MNTESPSIVMQRLSPVMRNLAAVGLIADSRALVDDAATVARAVEATLSDATQYRLFRAVANGVAGDAERATAFLAADMDLASTDGGMLVGKAVALLMAGSKEWRPAIDQVLAISDDQAVREAANAAIEYANTLD